MRALPAPENAQLPSILCQELQNHKHMLEHVLGDKSNGEGDQDHARDP